MHTFNLGVEYIQGDPVGRDHRYTVVICENIFCGI